jgi:hyaluronate lyase
VTVHVSEPPRTGRPLEVDWHHPVRRVLAHDPSVEVLGAARTLRLRITPGTAGAGHACTVSI